MYDPVEAGMLLEQAGWTDRDEDGVRENDRGEPLSISLSFNSGSQ